MSPSLSDTPFLRISKDSSTSYVEMGQIHSRSPEVYQAPSKQIERYVVRK